MWIKRIRNSIKRYFTDLLSVSVVLCMAAGWWGILYPQFTWSADTCRVVTEDGEEMWMADGTVVYREILNADRSRLRFRCKLAEEIKVCLERIQNK